MMERGDELLRALAGLRSRSPEEEWARRVRERCYGRLARAVRTAQPKPRRVGVLDAVTIAALCIYLAGILERAAQLVALRVPVN